MKNILILRKVEGDEPHIIVSLASLAVVHVRLIGEIHPAGDFVPYPNIGELGADQLQQLVTVAQNFELFYNNIRE